jgi:hypothetical protein
MRANKQATTTANPDAQLIALCERHLANMAALDANPSDWEESNPALTAYDSTRDAITSARAQTLAGMVAIAGAAKAEAAMPDGAEMFDCTMGGVWAWNIMNDLLRLHGGA